VILSHGPAREKNGVPDRNCRLTNGDFQRLGRYIYDTCGIRMPPVKKSMLESRLQKRLRSLGMASFAEYCAYLFSAEGQEQEAVLMIDLVTTNKTDFFREAEHFSYLEDKVLPEWSESHPEALQWPFRVWSAGCSSGEEPYTLAMVLQNFAERSSGFDFRVTGTDISTRMLDSARLAVYREERIAAVSPEFRTKYLLRSRAREERLVRIVPFLRSRVKFFPLNFMDDDFGFREQFDVIFCRNVIIYFDRPTQEAFLGRLCRQLAMGGHLFLGHSETLSGYSLPLKAVHPTVYRKLG
jgi:chemotaxis protein methyltransferase CheR